MYKWMYDRMIEEYEKESKVTLSHRIMALEEIEVSDRGFANSCKAGSSIYEIDELLRAFDILRYSHNKFSNQELDEIYGKASISWRFIRNTLCTMSDPSRVPNTLDNFVEKVNNAKDDMDII